MKKILTILILILMALPGLAKDVFIDGVKIREDSYTFLIKSGFTEKEIKHDIISTGRKNGYSDELIGLFIDKVVIKLELEYWERKKRELERGCPIQEELEDLNWNVRMLQGLMMMGY